LSRHLPRSTLFPYTTLFRSIRNRREEPFGGVQMIFIGDMHQLSPVAKTDEWSIISDYYDSVYFFSSHVIQKYPPTYIEFDRIFRDRKSTRLNSSHVKISYAV